MTDIPQSVFLSYFLYLFIPFVTGYIFRLLKFPAIIGYIIGGIIIGNIFTGIISSDTINHFAYFGIMLLLFAIGLEINLEKIFVLKKFIFIGGLLQVGLSTAIITVLNMVFGFNFLQSLFIAMAFSSSSTTLVAKIIQDRGEETSFLGELTLGVLMFQDLLFIPFVIIFSLYDAGGKSTVEIISHIILGIAEAAVILFLLFFLGKKVIPIIFDKIAKSSRELLNLFIIIFIFFIGLLSSLLGVPILISTFIAGVLVSQTTEHYHIFSQIRPLRDVLAIIFFVFIGTNINMFDIIHLLPQIALFTLIIMLAKIIMITTIFLYMKLSTRLAFALGVFLFQISENAFILTSLAYRKGVLSKDDYLIVITTVLGTLIVTPLLIRNKEVLYTNIRSFFKKYVPPVELFIKHRLDFDHAPLDEIKIKNHVVICGYGRVGSEVGKALFAANIPFVAIDYNFHTVQKAKKEGMNVIYGDPADLDVLDYAQVEDASILLLAVPERYMQEAIIVNAKKLNKAITVISRVHHHDHQQRMKDLGVHIVVQPEMEASLSIIKKIFALKQLPKDEIIQRVRFFKIEQGII